jgi:hypothetical protein
MTGAVIAAVAELEGVIGKTPHPMLRETCRRANRFVPGTWVPPASFTADR